MEFLNYLASTRTVFGEVFWNFITKFGEETILILLLSILYWCVNKKLAHIIGFTFFFSGYLVQGLKITFRIERPWIKDTNFKPVSSAYDTATGYSFPSGHTQSATAAYASIGFFIKKWWRIFFFIIPILIGFSRMYLGVHTPTDVITSFVFSIIISYCISVYYQKSKENHKVWLLILLIVFGFALMIYAFVLYNQQIIVYSYVADCCKTAGAGIGFACGVFLEQKLLNFCTNTKHFYTQIIKIAIGVIGLLTIQMGLKVLFSSIFGEALFTDVIRYFLMVLWISYIWPLIFNRSINKFKL